VYNVEAMREKWTDERLDDLNERVSEGFRRIDADLRELRAEMGANHRVLLQVNIGTIVTMVAGFLGVIVTQL
jgi:hypothetical protein